MRSIRRTLSFQQVKAVIDWVSRHQILLNNSPQKVRKCVNAISVNYIGSGYGHK